MMINPIMDRFVGYGELLQLTISDNRLLSTHFSLFTGLYIHWQYNGFESPFKITRRELMNCSKIASIATYHKCIRELSAYGYIRYQPSYHPQKGSMIDWPVNWEI